MRASFHRCLLEQVIRRTTTFVPSTSTSAPETASGSASTRTTGRPSAISAKSECAAQTGWKAAPLATKVHFCAQARSGLPHGLLVARLGRPLQQQHPRLPLRPAAGGPGVDQRRHRALGPGRRLVQQHRLERRPPPRSGPPCGQKRCVSSF